ncbi:MAG: hypothetical protein ACRCUT_07575, partial [Spirochaetota bacterium]
MKYLYPFFTAFCLISCAMPPQYSDNTESDGPFPAGFELYPSDAVCGEGEEIQLRGIILFNDGSRADAP